MTCNSLIVVLLCSMFARSISAQNPVVKLNGGLEASVLKIGRTRDHKNVTLSLRVANKGNKTAYLLLVEEPVATDDAGGIFKSFPVVSGIAYCHYGSWAASYCLGIPQKVDWTVPMQSFTQLDPNDDANGGITVNFRLNGQGDGPAVSFSADMYVRLVADPLKDEVLPDSVKYKQFQMMTLSFPPIRVTDAP
jgi:hypothetical protein